MGSKFGISWVKKKKSYSYGYTESAESFPDQCIRCYTSVFAPCSCSLRLICLAPFSCVDKVTLKMGERTTCSLLSYSLSVPCWCHTVALFETIESCSTKRRKSTADEHQLEWRCSKWWQSAANCLSRCSLFCFTSRITTASVGHAL